MVWRFFCLVTREGNGAENVKQLLLNLGVSEADDTVAHALKRPGALFIVKLLLLGVMDGAVHLDDEPVLSTVKVDDEAIDIRLAAKLQPIELAIAQGLPEGILRGEASVAEAAHKHALTVAEIEEGVPAQRAG